MRIVCLTSNTYHNCLTPFAYYWNRFAGADRRVTVACYDAPLPELPDNFDVVRIGKQADYNWSLGLFEFLNSIDDEFVLLMLEDYFLDQHIDWKVVDALVRFMRLPFIGKIDLTDDRMEAEHHYFGCFNGVELVISDDEAPFQTSLQAALWRKSFLWQCLSDDETPWQFEKQGTKRLIFRRQTSNSTPLILGTAHMPMHYANAVGGEGHKPGVIEAKHMPGWMWDECVEKGWAHG